MKKTIRNMIFFMQHYRRIKIELKKLPIKKIKIFKFKSWHHGYCYFSAFSKDNVKIFIKIDTKLLILENELIAYNLLKDDLEVKLIKVLDFIKQKSIQIILFEFLESRELTVKDIVNNPSSLLDIYNIIISMNKKNIIHRDIRLENFLIAKNKLYIIDFSFANHINNNDKKLKELPLNKENCLVLEGMGKRLDSIDFIWNDFYAIKTLLSELLINSKILIDDNTKDEIQKYINKFNACIEGNSYKITC